MANKSVSQRAAKPTRSIGQQKRLSLSGVRDPRSAIAATFDPQTRLISIALANGTFFAFPADQVQGLAGADSQDLSVIELTSLGTGLHWPRLDADLQVEGLLAGLFGSSAWMRAHAARAGSATSLAKARAARVNGAKGGRPRKLTNAA